MIMAARGGKWEGRKGNESCPIFKNKRVTDVIELRRLDERSSKLFEEKHASAVAQSSTVDLGANKEAYPLESTHTDHAKVNANLHQGDVIMYTRKRKLRSHSSESRDSDNSLETCTTALEDKVTSFEFAVEARNPNFTYIEPETKMTEEHDARKKSMYDTSMAEISASDFEPVAERSSDSIIVVSAEETPSKREGSCLQHCSPANAEIRHSRKKLIILDINGLLADIVSEYPPGYRPDRFVSRKAVFKRPFCGDFLRFCFETFDVGVWSSRTKRNVDMVVDFLLGRSRRDLVFCWDQSHCTSTGYHTIDNKDKPLVLKELKEIWNKVDPGKYNESNTLLLDDSPYKALRNPPNTAIFPPTYRFEDVNDRSLGPDGDLRVYLEGLASAENVQKYVEQNPFGQQAITESDPDWKFYSRVLGIERQQPEHDSVNVWPTLERVCTL